MNIFVDSGAPSLYNTLVRKNKGTKHSPMGSPLGDRKFDDFSFVETEEYKQYRDDYIEFIKEYREFINVYANLDIINNAELTWENQQYMEAAGLKPIPVWHFGCDRKWLQSYIFKGYDYIAIGGIVPNPPTVVELGLDEIFGTILTDDEGMPIVKTHGFAITSSLLLVKYPWYSVDSASWVKFGKYGIICIPKKDRMTGRYDYSQNPWNITVSDRSPAKSEDGIHISTVTNALRDYIMDYLTSLGHVVGKSEFKKVPGYYELQDQERFISGRKGDKEREVEVIVERGLCNDYRLRDEVNIRYYKDLEESVPEWPWPFNISLRSTAPWEFK